ncbi:nitrite reductase [Methanofollis formosanus]|uniref:Nitrite reductase n=1 Tax=Methanofollis formosanus TaxID=299308 RepID=A0A8G1A2R0_9EURY|nr:4Fe-4S binding protein [Methanofollis formosanus]QYZ79956.1 nitrite reductase [Methanofollis formosanus]
MMRDRAIYKRGGVITERNPDFCAVRLRIPAGVLTAEKMAGIGEIAKKYADGEVHLTTRQTMEIPHVDPARLEEVGRDLEKNGTPLGSEYDEVVNVIACPGTAGCKYSNIETYSLARRIDEKVFGREMPIRMRISLSGCPNACTSPVLNEIGIVGRIRPLRTEGMCTGCGTCAEYCKEAAIVIKNGISELIPEKCVQCGICIQSCPFDLLKSEYRHYLITIGGRRGRHPNPGRELITVESEDDVVAVVERAVTWVYRKAWSGRHLADQLDEIDFESFRKGLQDEFNGGTSR